MQTAKGIRRYFGDKLFYAALVAVVLPIVVQQGVTNLVNLLDNIMVGRLGTTAISSVAIVGNLIFVFNLALFGGISGASIYGAQYAGVGDNDGVRHTFRFKLIIGIGLLIIAFAVFGFFEDELIGLYLNQEAASPEEIAQTLKDAKEYLHIAVWALIPFMLSQSFAGTLRELGDTKPPMIAGICSFATNLVLNYVLIFGKLGLPAMGVRGAALATVIARVAELCYIIIWIYTRKDRYPFAVGALRSLRLPWDLAKRVIKTGWPLLLNETLWSMGQAMITQSFAVRGLNTVAATSITSNVWAIFAIVMMSMGNAISIMVGQKLGADDIEGAKDVDRKLLCIDFLIHLVIGSLVIATSGVIPLLYNVTPEVRSLTSQLLVIAGAALPLHCLTHATYFTLRAGGRTIVTFLFDCVFTWAIPLPLAFVLAHYTNISPVWIYFVVQFADSVKLAIGIPLLKSGGWARNVIN
ncbi:MAG TPA: MATE family efflux transporter [Eubacteriales bacterium]|nr:MATE family efflux transporter [Clostridia bacterium]HRV72674.1 MATE family efflux transporter [Eubacteriales bacterium]